MTDVWRLAISILLVNALNEHVGCYGPSKSSNSSKLKGLPGVPGKPGPLGPVGPPGPMGTPGYTGRSGLKGPTTICPCGERSTFNAKLSGRLPPPSQPVLFTDVTSNFKRNFKEDKGIFICEVPGNYYFSFDAEFHHCKVKMKLVRNHTQVLEKRQLSRKEHASLSGVVFMPLGKGDMVWLEAEVETEEPEQAEVTMYFSGFLNLS